MGAGERRAVVVGVGDYGSPSRSLAHPTDDAQAVARILEDAYGFRCTVLLDHQASLHPVQEALARDLELAPPTDQWLFFFAGHGCRAEGEKDGRLLLHDPEADGASLSLAWLRDLCLQSACRRTLIVLDACYSGQALVRRVALHDGIASDPIESRKVRQVLCAGGPEQPVLDGGAPNHSVFTQAFLEALAGWSPAHDAEGSIPFARLLHHLQQEVPRRLRLAGFAEDDLQETIGGNLAGTRDPLGFVLRCSVPLLPPRTVQLALSGVPEDRMRAMALAHDEGRDDERRLMAAEMALRSIPSTREPVCCRWGVTVARVVSPGDRERKQAARLLGALARDLRHESRLPRDVERRGAAHLLSLALRDPSPDVRHQARVGLRRFGSATRAVVGRIARKWNHRQGTPLRSRAWEVAAALPEGRAGLSVLMQGRAWVTIARLGALQARRVATATRTRRRLLATPPVLLLLLYLYLGASFYLSPVGGWVGIRAGHPGLTALPLVGKAVFVTGVPVRGMVDPELIQEERLRGFWWQLHDGGLPWARRLLDHMAPANAALGYWRLGKADQAFDRLAEGIAQGDRASVEMASYLAVQSGSAVARAVDLLVAALEAGDEPAAAARAGLDALATARPESLDAPVESLLGRIATAEGDRSLALLEALQHLEPSASPGSTRHAEILVDRLGRADPGSELEGRLAEAVAALVERRGELLSALGQNLADALLRVSPDARDTLLRSLALALEKAEEAGEPGIQDAVRRSLSSLIDKEENGADPLRLLGAATPLIRRSPRLASQAAAVVSEHLDEGSPADRLRSAEAILDLSSDPRIRRPAVGVLNDLIHRAPSSEMRFRAIERVRELPSASERALAADALLDLTRSHDSTARSAALDALLEMELRDGVAGSRLDPVLVAAFDDPSLWVRRKGAEGVLLFPDRFADAEGGDLVTEATSLIVAAIVAQDPASQIDARNLARRLSLAPAPTRRRFLQALEPRAKHDDFWAVYSVREFVEELLFNEPTLLVDSVQFCADLLVSSGDVRDQGISLLWSLGDRPAAELELPLEALLADAYDPANASRSGAVEGAAYLAAHEEGLAIEALTSLRPLADALDPELRLATVRALCVLAEAQPGLSPWVTPVLLDHLDSPRPTLRIACARGLGRIGLDPSSRSLVLRRLATALVDDAPEVRAAAADSFRRWGTGFPPARQWAAWLQAALRREPSPEIRVRQAAAQGVIAGSEESFLETTFKTLDLALESGDAALRSTALEGLWVLGAAHPESAPEVLHRLRAQMDAPDASLARAAILATREVGRSGPANGRLALELLADRLLHSSWDLAWDAIVNGISPICREHPELADRGIDALRSYLRTAIRESDPRREHLASTARSELLDLLEIASRDHPERIWKLLASLEPWDEDLGAELLARRMDREPDSIPAVQDHLASLHDSIWPQVRLTASRAAEMATILEVTHRALGDPERASQWRRALETLPEVDIHSAFRLSLDRLEPGTRHE